MKVIQEYQVNKFITLKLEKGKWFPDALEEETSAPKRHRTQIYINGAPFLTCKYLLLVNPHLIEELRKC
jgi:hypothetical protein